VTEKQTSIQISKYDMYKEWEIIGVYDLFPTCPLKVALGDLGGRVGREAVCTNNEESVSIKLDVEMTSWL
jgi:hypothetical protein